MITSIIFSKDRPLQLDLCLNSIKQNFNDSNKIIVIDRYSNKYKSSLENLQEEHQDVTFYSQTKSLYKDLKDWILLSKNSYVCFFTDDDIFFTNFSAAESYDKIFNGPFDVCCFSLRLGLNITSRWHQGQRGDDKAVAYHDAGDIMLVPKTRYNYGSYWSYSHSVDGHIFRKGDAIRMVSELYFLDQTFTLKQTPNALEENMQRFWAISQNTIACPKRSVVVNSPNNRVSDTHEENKSGEKFDLSPAYLLEIYKRGGRVDVNKLDFGHIECPHQEMNILKGLE